MKIQSSLVRNVLERVLCRACNAGRRECPRQNHDFHGHGPRQNHDFHGHGHDPRERDIDLFLVFEIEG